MLARLRIARKLSYSTVGFLRECVLVNKRLTAFFEIKQSIAKNEKEIDATIYKLFNLSDEESSVVEELK